MLYLTIWTLLAVALLSSLVISYGGSSQKSPSQDGVNLTGRFASDGFGSRKSCLTSSFPSWWI